MNVYSIGIDLGTTHCALSFLDLTDSSLRPVEQTLAVPQLTAPGAVEERTLLPSFLYLQKENEFAPGSLTLPWESDPHQIVGELARSHGSKIPTRLVSSAKSWLCHAGVDRREPLLPWQAPPEVVRVSPLGASASLLRYLRQAWDHKMKDVATGEQRALAMQDLILTVPASFDAAARQLTLEAAAEAGLPAVTFLEEPQAALYAWLQAAGDDFRRHISVGDVILVVDVGGGTTDFSLIAVGESNGELHLTRIAVGDHILLGGDNMDLALAHHLHQRLAGEGKKLDSWQLSALTHACRHAKEDLFGNPKLDRAPIAIASRGSGLIGGTIKTELSRADLTAVLTDGFFPNGPVTELPVTARRTGLAQLALPYAQDAAITRHLAAFLTRQATSLATAAKGPIDVTGQAFVHPTAILFNGGVFKAQSLQARLLDVLGSWLKADGGKPVKVLAAADLDLAVARGAAYYGWVRRGHGVRIRGGTARAYYIGVETAAPAVPGFAPPVKALCVAPFGMEEGTQADVPPQQFGLVVGEPTQFRFFASSLRREDKVGDFVEDPVGDEQLEELAPIQTTFPGKTSAAGELVPVNLQAAVTELGILELRCLEKNGIGRWQLELNVRPQKP